MTKAASTDLQIIPLTRQLAQKHIDLLTQFANLIPLVEYTPEEILSERKGERIFHGKWERSLLLLQGGQPIGFITGYERQAENNDQYPHNTIYISELAISPDFQNQGLGKLLIEQFIQSNLKLGMKDLSGPTNFSIQTNSAEFNQKVINLYKSFGFKPRAQKIYDNRVDLVMGMSPEV